MGTRGVVLLLEFWGCKARSLRDGQEMATLFRRVSRKLGSDVVHSAFRRFDTGGIGGFVTSYRGHLAVRSWPKDGHVMVDVYSCDERLNPHDAVETLESGFQAASYQMTEIDRGVDSGQPPLLVLPVVAESGMLPPEVQNDGGRDDVSGHPAAPEGVGGREQPAQLDGEGELEEPGGRPPEG